MSDVQTDNRNDRSDRRSDNRHHDRTERRGMNESFDRKRSWRNEGDDRDHGRDSKQMKPGNLGMKVLVPNSIVGAVIGKGGEEMKRIKAESECFIRLSQNDKYFPATNERPCYVEGEPEGICKALQVIQEKIINDNPKRGPAIDENRKKQCKIIVGSNAAGKTIGKGGENVKRLKSEYNVWIKCMGKDDCIPGLEERTINVSGELDSVMKAVKDILEMALTLNNGGTDKNLDYDRFMGGDQGGNMPPANMGGAPGGYNNSSRGGYNTQYNSQSGNMGGNMGMAGPAQSNNYGVPNQNMGGSYNQPSQQYGSSNTAPQSQFGQPGAFQGNIQQYPATGGYNNQGPTPQMGNNNTPSNFAIQQYPGSNNSQGGGGYNNVPVPYNQGGAGGYQAANQGGPPQGVPSGPQGGFNQGGYNQSTPQGGAPGNFQGGQSGYQGGNQGSNQGGYQGGNQGGYQGGNQGGYQSGNQGGFAGGNQGYQANQGGAQGGYQGGNQAGYQGGNNATRGGGNFRGGRGGGAGGGVGNGRGGQRGGGGGGAAGGRGGSRFSDRK